MKKDEFIFLIEDDNGNLRRLHAVNEFTLLRRENEADTLSVSVRNSYNLPMMRNVPEKEKIIAEYDGEVIFTGDIIGYERKLIENITLTTYTAKGMLNRLFSDESEPGIMKNPSARGIERRYLSGSRIEICSEHEAVGEMNVNTGTSVFELIKNFAAEFLGKNVYVRRNKIYFADDKFSLDSDKFKLKNAYSVKTNIDGDKVYECVKVMDTGTGQYSYSVADGDGIGIVYRNSLSLDEKNSLLKKRIYVTLGFKEKFEDIYPGDTAEYNKIEILADTVKLTMKNFAVSFTVGGYKREGDWRERKDNCRR